MVNYFTKKKKKINHLSLLLTEHRERRRHMTLEIHILGWNRHINVAGLHLLMGSQPKSLFMILSVGTGTA